MNAIACSTAEDILDETLDSVCSDHIPVIVTRPCGDPVVIISLEDFNSMQETAYLLGNPANAERLRRSIADAEAGRTRCVSLESL